jgi:hypothetical protein
MAAGGGACSLTTVQCGATTGLKPATFVVTIRRPLFLQRLAAALNHRTLRIHERLLPNREVGA